jgi:DNA-directed RNA polymerase II subunit RPB2
VKPGQPGYFKRKNGNYSLLDENGIIRQRANGDRGPCIRVKKGDVIIGKVVVTSSKTGDETIVDASRIVQSGEEGIIDRVHTMITPNGYRLVKVVIRKSRVPTLGDKVASRAAQKGTIGRIYHESEMPFSQNGIVPDIIINPLCMPSRMTVNQLIECVMGKECTMSGTYGDATPFTNDSKNVAEKVTEMLGEHGMEKHGWEDLYCGFSGEPIEAKIFMGPTYYQRLKHMVDDKMHARAKGHVTMMTRQPTEGRSRDGGLRFGEMERDCMIAHGASRFLKERLFDVSDPFQVPFCNKCGIIPTTATECQACKDDQVTMCNFPFASKLLVQELNAMCMRVAIRPQV